MTWPYCSQVLSHLISFYLSFNWKFVIVTFFVLENRSRSCKINWRSNLASNFMCSFAEPDICMIQPWHWWLQVLNIVQIIMLRGEKSLLKLCVCRFSLLHSSLLLQSVMWIKWCKHLIWCSKNLEHPLECVDYITAASAGVKNCCVNNCCIMLSVCTVWLNRLTALSILSYCDKMLWVCLIHVFVLCIMRNLKSLYFHFLLYFQYFQQYLIVGMLLMHSEVDTPVFMDISNGKKGKKGDLQRMSTWFEANLKEKFNTKGIGLVTNQ